MTGRRIRVSEPHLPLDKQVYDAETTIGEVIDDWGEGVQIEMHEESPSVNTHVCIETPSEGKGWSEVGDNDMLTEATVVVGNVDIQVYVKKKIHKGYEYIVAEVCTTQDDFTVFGSTDSRIILKRGYYKKREAETEAILKPSRHDGDNWISTGRVASLGVRVR